MQNTMFRLSTEPILFLYTFIFTITISVLPQLVLDKVCWERYANSTVCDHLSDHKPEQDSVQKTASWWMMIFFVCSYAPSFFTIMIWGPLTDIIGRKKGLIFMSISLLIQSIVYLINSHYMNAIPAYLIFGAILSSLYGDILGVILMSYSYIADLTAGNINDRTMRMATLECTLFLSLAPSALAAGYLLKLIGYQAVFIFMIVCTFILFLYVTSLPALLPHSDDVYCSNRKIENDSYEIFEKMSESDDSISVSKETIDDNITERLIQNNDKYHSLANTLNPFRHLKEFILVILNENYRSILIPLLLVEFLAIWGIWTENFVLALYLKNSPFNFNPELIGFYFVCQGVARGCGVILISQISHHYLRLSDQVLIILGFASQFVTYVLIGISRSALMVVMVNLCGIFVPLPMTTVKSFVSKQVSPRHYGTVIGSFQLIEALAAISCNFVTLATYNATLDINSGIVFFVSAACSLLGMVIFSSTSFKRKLCN